MTIIARQPIKKGDPIYHSYAREFTTTTFRRLILFSGNYDNIEIVTTYRCRYMKYKQKLDNYCFWCFIRETLWLRMYTMFRPN